jgi:outer membrane protein assembly factor BamE (lipoprotein component of BamABCDE complex)
MSLLKLVDRVALMSLLSVHLALPAAALAGCSTANLQALSEANLQGIHAGMTAAEVLERLGAPSHKTHFDRTATTSWDYRLADAWTFDSEFSVIFDEHGIVVSKFLARGGQ